MLLSSDILAIPLDSSISLKRLNLSKYSVEPLFQVEVALCLQYKRSRFILNLEYVVARISILDIGG